MSIQILGCENECTQCQKIYIPLHKEYPCPACGIVNKIIVAEDEYDEEHVHLDFTDQLIGSMKYYKSEYGQFTPLSSFIGGISGNIQHTIYWFFDKIEKEKIEYTPGIFDEEIKKYFGPEREYVLSNIKDILDEVYKRYLSENYFIIERIIDTEEQKLTVMKKIKKWFRNLVP